MNYLLHILDSLRPGRKPGVVSFDELLKLR